MKRVALLSCATVALALRPVPPPPRAVQSKAAKKVAAGMAAAVLAGASTLPLASLALTSHRSPRSQALASKELMSRTSPCSSLKEHWLFTRSGVTLWTSLSQCVLKGMTQRPALRHAVSLDTWLPKQQAA